ncbi:phosphotransferase family protein [Novosphingobium colocasiae]|uniref:phosphotransferase family protein n=1 Tax=Novosphingobium colocasiae TaxID=1256513 RepID=UPI0035B1B136
MTQADAARWAPDDRFIAAVRARFPVEPEMDRVLTAKLRDRASGAHRPVGLDELVNSTRTLIEREIGPDFQISRARWLGGGASKLQMAFDLHWRGLEGGEPRVTPMVVRMQPAASIVETSRRREFEMLQAMRGVVPVPECYWIDEQGETMPHPAIIYALAQGVAKPRARPSVQVTGIGTNFGPELRPVLAQQFVEHLARVHTAPAATLAGLTAFEPPTVGSNAGIVRQVMWWRRVWEEDRPEAMPLVELAAQWLIANAPELDHASAVHGDFRAGNFLFDEDSRQITAWLDWELAVIGDRHQDLSWLSGDHFGHFAEDGRTFLACGLLPRDELFERYEKASGLTVDPARLKYFRVYNDFASCVHMLATACRVAMHGKSHQDVLVAWLASIGHVISGALRDTLEEVL